jgi:hypothetical protein
MHLHPLQSGRFDQSVSFGYGLRLVIENRNTVNDVVGRAGVAPGATGCVRTGHAAEAAQ